MESQFSSNNTQCIPLDAHWTTACLCHHLAVSKFYFFPLVNTISQFLFTLLRCASVSSNLACVCLNADLYSTSHILPVCKTWLSCLTKFTEYFFFFFPHKLHFIQKEQMVLMLSIGFCSVHCVNKHTESEYIWRSFS